VRIESLPIVLGALPASVWAVDYVSASEAESADVSASRRVSRPSTCAWITRQLQEVGKRAGLPARFRAMGCARGAPGQLTARLCRGRQRDRQVRVDHVRGRSRTDGAIRPDRDSFLSRKPWAARFRLPACAKQFVGKTVAGPLRVGDDIANISGATLSCTHVTDGVRRIVAVLQVAHEAGALP